VAKHLAAIHAETTGSHKDLRPSQVGAAMPEEQPPDQRELGLNLTLAQVGVEMVTPLIVGLMVDHYAGTRPWFTIIGVILGFVGGLTHIVLLANRQEVVRREKKEKPGGGDS
jgi:F0F1-type ATP synthase assembly protein I